MDLDDLRLLDAVAVQGSFSAAAAKLRYSQPSVSARIAAIERGVGVELFIRDTRGARLTPAGTRYLGYVRRCLALLDSADRAVKSEVNSHPLRVGVPASYASVVAGPLIAATERLGVVVSVRSGHSPELRTGLLDDLLDLILTAPGPNLSGFEQRQAFETSIVAIAGSDRDSARTPSYAIHSWGQDDGVVSGLLAEGLPRTRIVLVSPASVAIDLALRNDHIAVVPEVCARQDLLEGRLHRVPLPMPTAHAQLVWTYAAEHEQRQKVEIAITHINDALESNKARG